MFKDPFSFEGRIRRTEYGLSQIIYFILLIIVGTSIEEGASIMGIFYIPLLWFTWAQGAKRCHDRGNSGWFQIIPFYPLWMLFAEGDAGENEYGEDPKAYRNRMSNNENLKPNTGSINQFPSTASSEYGGGYDGGHNAPKKTDPQNTVQNNKPLQQNGNNSNDEEYSGKLY